MALARLGFVESGTRAVARTASSRYDAAKALLVPRYLEGCVRFAERVVVVCAAPVVAQVTDVSHQLLLKADAKVNIVLSTGSKLLDYARNDPASPLTVAQCKDRSAAAVFRASEFVKANGTLGTTAIAMSASVGVIREQVTIKVNLRHAAAQATTLLKAVFKLGIATVANAALLPARTATSAARTTFEGIVRLTKAAIGLEMAGVRAAIAVGKKGAKIAIAPAAAGIKAATAIGVAGGKVIGAAGAHSLRMQWSVVKSSAKLSLAAAKFAASTPIQGPKAALAASKWFSAPKLTTAPTDLKRPATGFHITVSATHPAIVSGVRWFPESLLTSAAGPGPTAIVPRRSRHIIQWNAVNLVAIHPEFVWWLLHFVLQL